MKKRYVALTVFTVITVSLMMTFTAYAIYFIGGPGTYSTYMNATQSFDTHYYTDHSPSITYEYTNLKCSNTNAKLTVNLYARKIRWFDFFSPHEYRVGGYVSSGINGPASIWYTGSFNDVECASVSEIQNKYSYNFDNSWNLRFYYDISDNNGELIWNNKGEWLVHCSY